MLKVYGALLSPFVRKVRAVLAEKQLQYELVPTNPFEKSPEFLKRSPLGRIPAFEDAQGRRLADSTVIVEYLEECFPNPALFPKDPYERGRVRWFDEYADGGMAPSLTGRIFFQRVISAKLMRKAPDEAIISSAVAELPNFLSYLEKELGTSDWLVANAFTLADISIACQLINLRHAGIEIDAGKYPALAAWFVRVTSRASLKALIEQDQGFLAKLAA
jgi:glutathione S-transferase